MAWVGCQARGAGTANPITAFQASQWHDRDDVIRGLGAFLVALLVLAACAEPSSSRSVASSPPAPAATAAPGAAPVPTPPPPYSIDALRVRASHSQAGTIEVLDRMWTGDGFVKYHVRWTSGGQPMTGTISIPNGDGPFPVVIVNHGHIPPERYWIGQDSGIFGDPLAAHGFISLAPNYVGYEGSGPGEPGLANNERIAVTDMDLIASLGSLPKADATRVAVVGHSQGGGVSQILMVTDPRVRAVVLYAPVSSDEAENARRLHDRNGTWPSPNGDPGSNPTPYALMSPRNYFTPSVPPVLLIQGTLDHTIPAEHTQHTFDALQKAGVKSQLLWIPGGDHDLVGNDLARAVGAEETWIRAAIGI